MTTPLKQFIHKRRQELLENREAIDGELAELDRAEATMDAPNPIPDRGPTEGILTRLRRQQLGIKRLVLSALYKSPGHCLSANDILSSIKEDDGTVIERTSLSPQLSRLKGDGLLIAENNIWYLTPKGLESLRGLPEKD